jgi:hypothetical protein
LGKGVRLSGPEEGSTTATVWWSVSDDGQHAELCVASDSAASKTMMPHSSRHACATSFLVAEQGGGRNKSQRCEDPAACLQRADSGAHRQATSRSSLGYLAQRCPGELDHARLLIGKGDEGQRAVATLAGSSESVQPQISATASTP